MKKNAFSWHRLIRYPVIINPVTIISIGLLIIELLLLSWWRYDLKQQRKGKLKWHRFRLKKNSYEFVDLIRYIALVFINTFWWNEEKSKAYAYYVALRLELKFNNTLDKDFKTEQVEDAYEYYEGIKNKTKSNKAEIEIWDVPKHTETPLVEKHIIGSGHIYKINIGDSEIYMVEETLRRYLDAVNEILKQK